MLNYLRVYFCLLIAAGYCATSVDAQVFSFSSCPSVNVVSNFNVSQYAGKWYENRRYFAIFEFGTRCTFAEYTGNSNGGVDVKNTAKRQITGSTSVVTGTARQLEPPNGKLGVTFSGIPFSPQDAPYWVLDTDYTSYAVVWSCNNRGLFSSRIAWILTREQFPSDTVVNKGLDSLKKNNIDVNLLKVTSHRNC